MQIFDGLYYSKLIEERIQNKLAVKAKSPHLGILQIGDNASSEKFVSLKLQLCSKLGITAKYLKIDADKSDSEISSIAEDFFNDTSLMGVIVQLPLPKPTLYKILDKIPQKKDIDLLSRTVIEQNAVARKPLLSPVCRAFEYFLDTNNLKITSMEISVLGYGFLVGKPLCDYLLQHGAKVTVFDDFSPKTQKTSKTENLTFRPNYSKRTKINSQLVILSAGSPNLLSGEDLRPKTHVVDLGSSIVNGKTIGDLNMQSKLDHLGIISPSPKGLGPLVVRFLILNLLEYTK